MADIASGPRTLKFYDPGRDALERYPNWVIRVRSLPAGIPEVMCLKRKVILLNSGQTRHSFRCSLAHAIAHLDLGHVVIGGHLGSRQERDAESLAALRLIPIDWLADAIMWNGEEWDRVAEHVYADEPMLRARFRSMHPAHRAELKQRLANYTVGLSA